MVEILTTDSFINWLNSLKDLHARARIQARIERLKMDNPGDVKPVRQGISELRVNVGPGYRVYFIQPHDKVILLLWAGHKKTQSTDIKTAINIVKALK